MNSKKKMCLLALVATLALPSNLVLVSSLTSPVLAEDKGISLTEENISSLIFGTNGTSFLTGKYYLERDLDLRSQYEYTQMILFLIKNDVEIDLQTHKIEIYDSILFSLTEMGTLKIKNGTIKSIGGLGPIINVGSQSQGDTSVLTLENVNIENKEGQGISIDTANLDSGYKRSVEIEGGEIKTYHTAICQLRPSKVTIKEGTTIQSKIGCGIETRAGELIIEDGTITGGSGTPTIATGLTTTIKTTTTNAGIAIAPNLELIIDGNEDSTQKYKQRDVFVQINTN